jgi:outer membrane lipoprotein-sorting protein
MKTGKSKLSPLNHRRVLGIVLFAISFLMPVVQSTGVEAQGKDSRDLQPIFKQMESAGKSFQSFYAKISEKEYTAILKEFGSTKTGEFYLARAKDGSTMMRQDISSPGREILTIKGNMATLYRPKINEAQTFNLGKSKDQSAEFLALGIGQPPTELQKNYDISYQGEESIEGTPCTVLTLKPKKPNALYTSIVWWVKKSSGIPIQQKLQQSNNDYLLVTFSGEKLNIKIPDSKFDQNLAGVQVQRF